MGTPGVLERKCDEATSSGANSRKFTALLCEYYWEYAGLFCGNTGLCWGVTRGSGTVVWGGYMPCCTFEARKPKVADLCVPWVMSVRVCVCVLWIMYVCMCVPWFMASPKLQTCVCHESWVCVCVCVCYESCTCVPWFMASQKSQTCVCHESWVCVCVCVLWIMYVCAIIHGKPKVADLCVLKFMARPKSQSYVCHESWVCVCVLWIMYVCVPLFVARIRVMT